MNIKINADIAKAIFDQPTYKTEPLVASTKESNIGSASFNKSMTTSCPNTLYNITNSFKSDPYYLSPRVIADDIYNLCSQINNISNINLIEKLHQIIDQLKQKKLELQNLGAKSSYPVLYIQQALDCLEKKIEVLYDSNINEKDLQVSLNFLTKNKIIDGVYIDEQVSISINKNAEQNYEVLLNLFKILYNHETHQNIYKFWQCDPNPIKQNFAQYISNLTCSAVAEKIYYAIDYPYNNIENDSNYKVNTQDQIPSTDINTVIQILENQIKNDTFTANQKIYTMGLLRCLQKLKEQKLTKDQIINTNIQPFIYNNIVKTPIITYPEIKYKPNKILRGMTHAYYSLPLNAKDMSNKAVNIAQRRVENTIYNNIDTINSQINQYQLALQCNILNIAFDAIGNKDQSKEFNQLKAIQTNILSNLNEKLQSLAINNMFFPALLNSYPQHNYYQNLSELLLIAELQCMLDDLIYFIQNNKITKAKDKMDKKLYAEQLYSELKQKILPFHELATQQTYQTELGEVLPELKKYYWEKYHKN